MKRSRHRARAFTAVELEARVAKIMAFAHPVGAEQRAEKPVEVPSGDGPVSQGQTIVRVTPGQPGPAERPVDRTPKTRWDAAQLQDRAKVICLSWSPDQRP